MLVKRRIEAEILGHVYAVLKSGLGQAAAMQVIGAARRSSVAPAQRFIAVTEGSTSLQAFIALSRLWQAKNALKIEVREQIFAFVLLRRRNAQMYRAMGFTGTPSCRPQGRPRKPGKKIGSS